MIGNNFNRKFENIYNVYSWRTSRIWQDDEFLHSMLIINLNSFGWLFVWVLLVMFVYCLQGFCICLFSPWIMDHEMLSLDLILMNFLRFCFIRFPSFRFGEKFIVITRWRYWPLPSCYTVNRGFVCFCYPLCDMDYHVVFQPPSLIWSRSLSLLLFLAFLQHFVFLLIYFWS